MQRNIHLAEPRGFCNGVKRALKLLQRTIDTYGAPVYMLHEIVHNSHVVSGFKQKGAVFVESLDEVPNGAVVVFSAHGVARTVIEEAERRQLKYVETICPLVAKVHAEIRDNHANGRTTVVIGNPSHAEIIGTRGQVPESASIAVRDREDAAGLEACGPLGYVTQTTLSADETESVIAALKERFPDIKGPDRKDICYATTERQTAVKKLAKICDIIIVAGSPSSSNSKQLLRVAQANGCPESVMVEDASGLDMEMLAKYRNIGITAGASTPEETVGQIVRRLGEKHGRPD